MCVVETGKRIGAIIIAVNIAVLLMFWAGSDVSAAATTTWSTVLKTTNAVLFAIIIVVAGLGYATRRGKAWQLQ